MLLIEDIEELIHFIRFFIEKIASKKEEEIKEYNFLEKINAEGIFISLVNYKSQKRIFSCGYPRLPLSFKEAIENICTNIFLQLLASNIQNIQDILKEIIFEISFVKNLEYVKIDKPMEYTKKINVVKEGIMIQRNFYIASILPQVALENNWDVVSTLAECSMDAGLPADVWMEKGTNIFKFQVDVYREIKPYGKIIKIEI